MAKVSEKLQQAIDGLVIQDVYLKSSKAHCAEGFDPKSTELDSLLVQQMHVVHRSELVQINDDGQLVRIYVRMGTRWVSQIDSEESDIKAHIEADFIAEYQLTAELEQDAIDEFALKNASFHVWPYWREFLSSQCERLRLPRVVLPTVQFSKQ
ncbi:preprotein translocase subunit SecB [Oceanisphaera avium]|uniref:Preprotein translocase subunit SecB n=1 Tax=Oceanisphaera avium TaxID=1903694 RepID=A0A1Y0CU98_9GAMM|nr:preprotein translocase subunit SecB [Oceanisphaera avium]ART78920.1 preprotein translocase subunit SecB [Oceanisphaera avium]